MLLGILGASILGTLGNILTGKTFVRFNEVFSRGNLLRIKDGEFVININQKKK